MFGVLCGMVSFAMISVDITVYLFERTVLELPTTGMMIGYTGALMLLIAVLLNRIYLNGLDEQRSRI